jgi:ligand-binding sensor domain-containing protein
MIGTELFAGTDGSGVFRSADYGNSWEAANNGIDSAYVNSVVVIGNSLFVAADGSIGIYRSDDSGVTWRAANTGIPQDSGFVNTYVFSDGNENLFMGSDNGFFFSTNGGTSWVEADAGLPTSGATLLNSVVSFTELGSEIFVGTSGAGVWRRPLSEMINTSAVATTPSVEQSIAAYPNPFSQSSTITFSCAQSGAGEVTIVNLLGAEVARLFSGELSAGEHSFEWDASGVPAGMYVCVVRAGGEVQRIPILHY